MPSTPFHTSRRRLLQSAAALAVAGGASATFAKDAEPDAEPPTAKPSNVPTPPTGKPGEFDFLTGEWRIRNRRKVDMTKDDWDEFDGEATCFSILGGRVSVEELRIPTRDFAGMGLRALDAELGIWHDVWMNAKSGKIVGPGMPGGFKDNVGTFLVEEADGDALMLVRGQWDNISATTCRWEQAISKDGGKTWLVNWAMDWTRV